MNKLTPDGKSVIDSNGKAWALDTAHPLPLPDGVNHSAHMIYWHPSISEWNHIPAHDTHWRLRTEPPAPKTQEEMDEEAFDAWVKRDAVTMNRGMERAYSQNAWRAALAYERGKARHHEHS